MGSGHTRVDRGYLDGLTFYRMWFNGYNITVDYNEFSGEVNIVQNTNPNKTNTKTNTNVYATTATVPTFTAVPTTVPIPTFTNVPTTATTTIGTTTTIPSFSPSASASPSSKFDFSFGGSIPTGDTFTGSGKTSPAPIEYIDASVKGELLSQVQLQSDSQYKAAYVNILTTHFSSLVSSSVATVYRQQVPPLNYYNILLNTPSSSWSFILSVNTFDNSINILN